MFITKKHISRRTVLRGAGAAVALPFLESMVGAQTATRNSAAAPKSRLACIEICHGSAGSTHYGTVNHLWSPAKVGKDFEFTKILKPLESLREYTTIVSHTDCDQAFPASAEEVGADHFRSSAVFLSGAHPKQTEGSDVYNGTTIDQMYAQQSGQETPLPSIQLSIENLDSSGTCGYNYSCVYMDTISWANPATPLPMTRDPRLAFEELFGSGGSAQDRASRQRVNKSVLDRITHQIAHLRKELGPRDKNRLNEYLENVREIERRIEKIEQYNASNPERELPSAPIGIPDSWEDHVKLMYDLQVLAFAAEVTRVSTFKLSRDTSQRVFAESGSTAPFHSASHHQDKPELIEDKAKINRYHVSLLAYFMDRLKNTPDGDGNLLDHSLVFYGSPMSDGNVHGHKRAPMLIGGKASGKIQGNMHVLCADSTPQANILLTVVQKLGLNVEFVGNSTGPISI